MYNDIWDHELREFLEPFRRTQSGTPRKLDLTGNDIGRSGYVELSELLKSRYCTLEEIVLYSLNGSPELDDDMVCIFAGALETNDALRELEIETHHVTNVGWGYLESALCDTTSISATFASNHTLVKFGSTFDDQQYIPNYFRMNQHRDKAMVARLKVIDSHFARQFCVDNFKEWKPSLLVEVLFFVRKAFLEYDNFLVLEPVFDSREGIPANNSFTIYYLILKNNVPTMVFGKCNGQVRKQRRKDDDIAT